MLVGFFVIGAQKSGTTSLASSLALHPEICISRKKEPHYFSKKAITGMTLDEYHGLFECRQGQICGEASTSYTFCEEYPNTASELYSYNPQAKLIYIVRDPIERIVSHLAHRQLRGRARRSSFEEVLENPIYVSRSRYALQLNAYLEHFERAQILILIFEQFIAGQRETVKRVVEFLGKDPDRLPSDVREHRNETANNPVTSARYSRLAAFPGFNVLVRAMPAPLKASLRHLTRRTLSAKPELPPEILSRLREKLADDTAQFERLLGHRVAEWRFAHPEH